MPTIIYKRIEDKINKAMYEVRVPEMYDPTFPDYFLKHKLTPFYNPNELSDCISMMAIKHMIDMCFLGVPFIIVKKEDFNDVLDTLEAYVEYIYPFKGKDNKYDQFITRCEMARNTLKDEANRIQRVCDYKQIQSGRPLTLQAIIERICNNG